MPFCSYTNFVISTAVVGLALLFAYYRKDFDPQIYSLPPPPKLDGALTPNKHLRNAQLLLKGQILGPESLLVENDAIYTGTWDGKILKIVDGVITKTVRLTNETVCGTFDTEPVCGRPLGIRRLNSELLIVADAYFGIYTIDFEKESWRQVFSSKTKVNGEKLSFINDLDVLDERTVFFSDSSSRWDRRRFLQAFLEQKPDGRVFQLDVTTGVAKPLLGSLHFANGLQLHSDKQSLLISECAMARIVRFYFAGPKKGKREMFIENLPGFPDNIRVSRTGTFYVGVAGVRHADDFPLLDKLGNLPWLRKLIVGAIPERYLTTLFTIIKKKYGMVVEFDAQGKIVSAPQDPDGLVIPDVSQASDDATHIYLGSFHSDFIAKVPKKGL
ncbi:strictosidine synthase domain-containing protein [Ditylenchus destructor]|nr:strictosidine synthase domain-containing protein [Ditylenchus destructor]